MVTMYIDLSTISWNETFRLLRDLERKFKTQAVSTTVGDRLIWQILVDEFEIDFWKKIAEGNDFELYTHKVDRHW